MSLVSYNNVRFCGTVLNCTAHTHTHTHTHTHAHTHTRYTCTRTHSSLTHTSHTRTHTHSHTEGRFVALESVSTPGQYVGILPDGSVKPPDQTRTGPHGRFVVTVHARVSTAAPARILYSNSSRME